MTRPWECKIWTNLYRAAVLELEPNKMPTKIRAARYVINQRLSEIRHSVDDKPEQHALEEALNVLGLLEATAGAGESLVMSSRSKRTAA